MDETIIATYCLYDDLLQAMHHRPDPQCKRSDAEVMTTALTAALFFRGTRESARMMLKQHGYIPQMLSKRHFIRRLHRLKETFILLFNLLVLVCCSPCPQSLLAHPNLLGYILTARR